MRTLQEYVQLAKDKYDKDHAEIGSSMQECVGFVIDKAFFDDEISAPIIDPLKDKILLLIKNGK